MNYFIYHNDEVAGPYTVEQMLEMLGTGLLTSESLVFIDGEADWKAFADIPELKAPAKAPAPVKAAEPAKAASGPKPGGGPAPAKKVGPKPSAAPVKKTAPPAKKAVSAPTADDGAAAPMSDKQREAYEAAMAKKESGGGSKMKWVAIIGGSLLGVLAIVAALVYFDVIAF